MFSLGCKFNTYEQFKEEFEKWQKETGQLFVIRNSKTTTAANKSITQSKTPFESQLKYASQTYKCIHGSEYGSKSKGARPNQKLEIMKLNHCWRLMESMLQVRTKQRHCEKQGRTDVQILLDDLIEIQRLDPTYTMSKYGMSMCVLGMSEEFKEDRVAVNALWPRTAIWTDAVSFFGNGKESKVKCRKPEVVSDAAYIMLTRSSAGFTGNFSIAEDILASAGVTDMDQYAYSPGSILWPDFFVNDGLEDFLIQNDSCPTTSENIAKVFEAIQLCVSTNVANDINATYQITLTDNDSESWYIDLKNGAGSAGPGKIQNPDCTLILDNELFNDLFDGRSNYPLAYMMGRLKIKGDLTVAVKLEKLMKKIKEE